MTTGTPDLAASLERLSEALDIPPGKYRDAVNHFTAVANWLGADGSPLKPHQPTVYPQGSFRIGTVVRPVRKGREADYDIDLVCRLNSSKAQLSPRELKNLIGDRLKEHDRYREMLDEEGRRCWTLHYAEADDIGFHLDALPALSEDGAYIHELVGRGVDHEYARHAIEITERLRPNEYVWVDGGSNPYGYASWFDSVNSAAIAGMASVQKRRLFEASRPLYASVRDVPDALLRSPLQRAIQLLKRHRDVRFAQHKWEPEKPISMIITTLAARAYRGDADVAGALMRILESIDDFARTGLIDRRNGEWWIPNPVNQEENFADRWNVRGSHRAEAFFEWVSWVRQDLALADEPMNLAKRHDVLAEAFGVAVSRLTYQQRSGTLVPVAAEVVPDLANASHCQPPPWPLDEHHRVKVSGSVRSQHGASRPLWRLNQRPVPKGFWIRFEAETDTPPPYDVQWQVVNTGREADTAGAHELRGGFDDGEGTYRRVRWETTRYRGTHWIEAFVLKDGACVARSGRTFVRVR